MITLTWGWFIAGVIAIALILAFLAYIVTSLRSHRARRRHHRARGQRVAHREPTAVVTAGTVTAGTAVVVAGAAAASLLPTPPASASVPTRTFDTGRQKVVTPTEVRWADVSASVGAKPPVPTAPVVATPTPQPTAAPAVAPAAAPSPTPVPRATTAARHATSPTPAATATAKPTSTAAPAPAAVTPTPVRAPQSAGVSGIALARYAQTLIGIPYVYGGTTVHGFDCSGLTQYVYAHFGITIPRTAHEQKNAARAVSAADAQPGDLVFFGSPAYHVAIYLGNGLMVTAPTAGDHVKVESDNWAPHTFGRFT